MLDSTNLPRSWQIKTLGEVCDIIMGQSPLGEKVIDKSQNTDSKALEFHQGKICFTDNFISESEVVTTDIRKIAPKDSILLYVRAPVGVVNITQRRIAIGRGLCALNLKDSSNNFLYFYLLTLNNYFNQKATGSTFSAINLDTIKNTKIPIPPLEIQKRIVKRLDEAFSRIENGTKHLKSAKDNLTKYKQSLLKSAFNGTLTNESATPSLHSKSIAQSSLRGSNATEAIHKESTDSTESSLRANEMSVAIHKKEIDCHESLRDSRNDDKDLLNGKSANLPQGWTIKTLGEIGEIVSGGTPTTSQADNFGGNIAWITPADLSNHNNKFISQGKRNISEKGLKNSSARLMPKGTILFSSRAPIGYVAIASNPLCTNQGFKSLIPNENIFSEFVYYYLLNSKSLAESYASGTTFKEISAKSFSKLPIPIPPLETQKQIVAILERHFTSADKVSAYIESCLTKAKQLKSSILKSAFEGKL